MNGITALNAKSYDEAEDGKLCILTQEDRMPSSGLASFPGLPAE